MLPGKPPLVQATSCRALAAARMLVASYFIAHATGVIVVPDGIDFVPRTDTATVASWATITVVWLTGVALFVGRIVRPAALILGLYTVVSALVSHAGLFAAPIAHQTLWVEIAMVGALSLIALTARISECPLSRDGMGTQADRDDELSRTRLELAATRAALAEIQASETVISYAPAALRKSA
ncbi:DoxX family membrane protein [Rhodovulum marinum]|uniref:Putative membrane protein YphA (DoxX/SURF4 family) n=1 Tax=Rhodovulum marinum TaxID=320662 RepID=A0A4R2PXV4_9RHOB|nr:DoxX family membrane protein [Rhodovulum marinum]TCP40960.1 putative membrane protein YphA (DoxX/SURF4 family) [Rhodovulum marinum]